jgi:hypothetical protein
MTPEQFDLALVAIHDIEDYARRGDVAKAQHARRRLNALCADWNDGRSYPPEIREVLRERNLSTSPKETSP